MIKIRFDYTFYNEQYLMWQWCNKHFENGVWKYPTSIQELEFEYPVGNSLTVRWLGAELYGELYFLFRDEDDAAFFSLRWC